MADSVFLAIDPSRWVAANQWAFAIRDQFPVSPGHTLIIPRRVVAAWWSATTEEQNALMQLVDEVKAQLDARYAPAGYNVGFNAGDAAGQTVFHLHVHVIPRYRGDMPDPRGGVRHVIPHKGNYLTPANATANEPDAPSSITPTSPIATDSSKPLKSSTPIEQLVDDVIERADLTAWLLTIITAGRKTATYKPALLMALLDTAIDSRCDPHSELVVSVDDLAHRIARYYWPQTNISPLTNGILKQATGNSRITDALVQLRTSAGVAPWTDLDEVALTHPKAYARALDTVADTLIRQPIPRLQRPGSLLSRDGYSPRLYDDSGFTSERVSRTSSRHLTLRPGVAHTLAVNALSLRPAVESIWCREVVRYNRLNSQEEQLREFLFGTQRRSSRRSEKPCLRRRARTATGANAHSEVRMSTSTTLSRGGTTPSTCWRTWCSLIPNATPISQHDLWVPSS